MNGCLRFKVKETHEIYKNLNETMAAAKRDKMFDDPKFGGLFESVFDEMKGFMLCSK